jgi:hypothetical protein
MQVQSGTALYESFGLIDFMGTLQHELKVKKVELFNPLKTVKQ